jgi:hypothetical protein
MSAFGAGCGGDDDDGAGGNGGKKSSNLSAADVAGGACEMMSGGDDSECKGVDEYSECTQNKCAAEYKTCLGAGYAKGDFSGGKCETYFSCINDSKDKCQNDCERDAACTACFVSTLATCVASAGCTYPTCTTGGNAGKGSATGGGSGGSGESGKSGGTAGITGTGNKTCKELESCCNSLPASQKEPCVLAYNNAKGLGDAACSGVYSVFGALGCK